MSHTYLNVQYINLTTTPTRATTQVDRMEKPLEHNRTHEYLVSVDRFYCHGIRLPVFQLPNNYDLTISIQTIIGGATTNTNLTSATSQFYNYQDLVTLLQTAITSGATAHGVAVIDIPVITFSDTSSNYSLFTITTTANFRALYRLGMNAPLYKMLNTFPATTTDYNTYYLTITANSTLQPESTINMLSPVSKLLITTNMPVKQELIPNPIGFDFTISQNAKPILTDFKMTASNASTYFDIQFTTTEYRYISLLSGDWNRFDIEMRWQDYENVDYPIYLDLGSVIEIKLLFVLQ